MFQTLRWSFAAGLVGAILLTSSACLGPSDRGAKQAGQSCTADADCAKGLVCSGRRCIPRSGTYGDALSGGDSCSPGSRSCLDAKRLQVCNGGTPSTRTCSDDQVCRQGECVDQSDSCTDADDDGYGQGCSAGPDCDDDDPDVHPGAEEKCGNAKDDDCDGEVDENCGGCCPDGCGDQAFCNECSCTEYNPNRCEYAYQPCATEGGSGAYFCTRLAESDPDSQRRCYSSCDPDADNPNAQCSGGGAECLRVGENDRGLCVRSCTFDQGCGLEGFGCLPFDGAAEGVCMPADEDNQVGDTCESTFDCSSRAICGPFFERGGDRNQCVEACRPFADGTDCSEGHCVPLQRELGVCREDADASTGETCEERFAACGEDATICAPSRRGTQSCRRLCRTDRGGEDCNGGECEPVDFFGPDIGVCEGD